MSSLLIFLQFLIFELDISNISNWYIYGKRQVTRSQQSVSATVLQTPADKNFAISQLFSGINIFSAEAVFIKLMF
jgi:hypothetical protein